jgi:hypothetical protein
MLGLLRLRTSNSGTADTYMCGPAAWDPGE